MGNYNRWHRYLKSLIFSVRRVLYYAILALILIGDSVRNILKLIVNGLMFIFINLFTLSKNIAFTIFITLQQGFKIIPQTQRKIVMALAQNIKNWRWKFSFLGLRLKHKVNLIKYSKTKDNQKKSIPLAQPIEKKKPIIWRKHAVLTGFLLGVLVSAMIFFVHQSYRFVSSLPSPALIGTVNFPVSTKIMDKHGVLLYEVYRDENRTPVKSNEIPSYLIDATIATEDKDFYNHRGISLYGGVLRAIKEMLVTGQIQGGSTITQQLVKTSLLTPERSLTRKLKEALLAIWTERMYSKEQILEMYLNQVSFGGAAYGVEKASQTYFGKHASELNLYEAAFLAGLPQAPTSYSPFLNPQLAQNRRNEVLRRMLEDGYISLSQYEEGIKTELAVKAPKDAIRAPHFVFYIRTQLEKQYGAKRVEEGGLQVVTTLDLTLQEAAESILREELAKVGNLNISNGAILVVNPKSGAVMAMVGSRDYFEKPYGAYNVTTALRQPGSSVKPIMYSLALEKGYTAASIIDDSPVIFRQPGSKDYIPVNYDGRFHGKVTLRQALANSYNIPAVKTLNQLGVREFISHAQNLGISTWTQPDRYGLSLTLGGGEVTMMDMAAAFGAFANGGKETTINPIETVENYRNETLFTTPTKSKNQVLTPESAFIISDILADDQARSAAFGPNSNLAISGYRISAKTGTTNDKRDNWTIGFTNDVVVAVWVGNNNNSPMNPRLTSGITGSAPIFNRVMRYILENDQKIRINAQATNPVMIPAGVVKKNCFFGKVEYFAFGTEKKVNCSNTILITPTPTP